MNLITLDELQKWLDDPEASTYVDNCARIHETIEYLYKEIDRLKNPAPPSKGSD